MCDSTCTSCNLAVAAAMSGAVTTFLSHVRPNTSVNRDLHLLIGNS